MGNHQKLMRRALFWLPIVLWLSVEVYLLRILFLNSKPGGDPGALGPVLLWGFPSSIIAVFVSGVLPVDYSTTGGFVAQGLLFGIAGVIQWYLVLGGGLSRLLRKLWPSPFDNRDDS